MKLLFVIIPLISAALFFVLVALIAPKELTIVILSLGAISIVVLYEEIKDAKVLSRFKK